MLARSVVIRGGGNRRTRGKATDLGWATYTCHMPTPGFDLGLQRWQASGLTTTLSRPHSFYGLGNKSENLSSVAPPLGREIPLISCVRYMYMELGKPCCTKLSVVSFFIISLEVRYRIKSKNMINIMFYQTFSEYNLLSMSEVSLNKKNMKHIIIFSSFVSRSVTYVTFLHIF